MEKFHTPTLMQVQSTLPRKVTVTTGIMTLLILFVYLCAIPNPNMILIAGLVLCSALFGFGGGIVAAVIMVGYSLFFFSTDHSFTQFTPQNIQKVAVSVIGATADMVLVCLLKRAEVNAFDKVQTLTRQLHLENEQLQQISLTDSLTGIRNRMALKRDTDAYLEKDVSVMMLDLNDFKSINDTLGHDEGDRILVATGKLLADTFGAEHCYRYGGDEFLVIVPGLSRDAFQHKLDEMMKARPLIRGNRQAGFAVGWVHTSLSDRDQLRAAICSADERMYQQKRDSKLPAVTQQHKPKPRERVREYTVPEIRTFLSQMSQRYALARVVDPNECRILSFREDGKISMNESCYGIWNAGQKCINCSSATACRTGCHQEKAEHFQDNVYFIQSNPVKLKLDNGSVYDAVVELVSVEAQSRGPVNNRAAENVGNRAAHYLAHHDSLTNVLNADAFYELSREMIKNTPDRSWVMVTGNIMNFRLVNTLFGVTRGNEVLVKTAALLREISERAGGLCGRLGGDQFAMLLPGADYQEQALLDTAKALADAFRSGIYTFCIHFGVYRIDDASIPVSVMCGRANSALRTIREDLSKTVACFDNTILHNILREQKVTGSFEDAMQRGEFRMYLQPLVDHNGRTIGAEALARWVRSDGSLVMPGDFIPVLEHAGLIQQLDVYIWELAIRQLSAWKGTDKAGLSISVNMSAKDFYSIDVYEVLTRLVEQYDVDCSLLRLEITETALLVEPDKSDAVVSKLRQRGFLVEIDDFGKGYSSLSLLKNIQADVLKIDMGFLHEISEHERSRVILETVISLASSLGMEVITEGVETQQQLQVLCEMGCRHFQGFYFSRPIPVEEYEARLASEA